MRKRRGGRYKEPPDPAIVEENARRWLEYGKGDVHSLLDALVSLVRTEKEADMRVEEAKRPQQAASQALRDFVIKHEDGLKQAGILSNDEYGNRVITIDPDALKRLGYSPDSGIAFSRIPIRENYNFSSFSKQKATVTRDLEALGIDTKEFIGLSGERIGTFLRYAKDPDIIALREMYIKEGILRHTVTARVETHLSNAPDNADKSANEHE